MQAPRHPKAKAIAAIVALPTLAATYALSLNVCPKKDTAMKQVRSYIAVVVALFLSISMAAALIINLITPPAPAKSSQSDIQLQLK